MIAKVSTFFRAHPMLKGMAMYSVIWPTSSVVQQVINKEDLDWKKSARFFMFGTFFVAPTLYGWIKLTSSMWPSMNLKNGITKALVEQISYGPMAGVSFFTLMTLMEGKSFREACNEVGDKFPQTYKVGVCFWPIVQTINFTFISERNRVPFVSGCSFLWTIFLAYMKQLEAEKTDDINIEFNTKEPHPSSEKEISFYDRLKSKLETN
ncbi:unnamed protein product [Diamesa serratosioi]